MPTMERNKYLKVNAEPIIITNDRNDKTRKYVGLFSNFEKGSI